MDQELTVAQVMKYAKELKQLHERDRAQRRAVEDAYGTTARAPKSDNVARTGTPGPTPPSERYSTGKPKLLFVRPLRCRGRSACFRATPRAE